MTAKLRFMWEDYRRQVISSSAPPIQLYETQLAFMAGAHAVLALLAEAAHTLPEEQAIKLIGELRTELDAFVDGVTSQGSMS